MYEIFLFSVITTAIIALITTFLLMLLFKRSDSEVAIVRTGLFGSKVAIDSGMVTIPILQRHIKISMKTMEIEAARENKKSVLSKDYLRVDVIAHFFIKVDATDEAVTKAAQTLGDKTFDLDEMVDILEERCESALIAIINGTNFKTLHEDKTTVVKNIKNYIKADLATNGLALQSVAIKHVEQAQQEFFNPQNLMDTQGLTRIKRQIAEENEALVKIETENDIKIRELKLKSETQGIDVDKKLAEEENEKQRMLDTLLQETNLIISKNHVDKEREVELFILEKDIAIATKQKSVAEIRIETNALKAKEAKASEEIITSRERAKAERNKEVEVISARREAERQQILATANKNAAILDSEGAKARYKVEAEGKQAINQAANELSSEQIEMGVRMEVIKQLPEIVKQSVKPIENIESIKITEVGGLTGNNNGGIAIGGAGGNNNGSGSPPSLPDQVVDSALRYKAHAPIVDGLLRDIGIDGLSVNSISEVLKDKMSPSSKSKESGSSTDKA
ncbi:MAG: hypothetical protein KAH22_03985 [Thiotrichaceae bacterium]|nr:hypothetical protein [Thiotrichaceae bacterium]